VFFDVVVARLSLVWVLVTRNGVGLTGVFFVFLNVGYGRDLVSVFPDLLGYHDFCCFDYGFDGVSDFDV